MDADVQIWNLFDDNGQKNELYDEVMLDAIGKEFEKFSVKWNEYQKQVGDNDIMATKNCSRIIGNYNENYEDDPRDWSASEGEIEIVWDTDDLEDFGVFRGDTSTYLVDYDMVSSHEDLIEEVIGMIGEEYPDLDFGRDDFIIINEDEFWEQRGGNPGLWDDDDLSVVDEAISDDGV